MMDDVLGVLGLGFVSAAAFTVSVAGGLLVVGGCLLFAAWRLGRP